MRGWGPAGGEAARPGACSALSGGEARARGGCLVSARPGLQLHIVQPRPGLQPHTRQPPRSDRTASATLFIQLALLCMLPLPIQPRLRQPTCSILSLAGTEHHPQCVQSLIGRHESSRHTQAVRHFGQCKRIVHWYLFQARRFLLNNVNEESHTRK